MEYEAAGCGSLSVAFISSLSIPFSTAFANSSPTAPVKAELPSSIQANPEHMSVGDIVVTARRREESLQKTPVSITAFSVNDLYIRSINKLSNLQSITPGLQVIFAPVRTNPTLAMRGQRRSSIAEGAPAVPVYENEVPLPALGSLIPTYDVSSLQVLKGPQGTLFGRNATAGVILIYSAPPTN